MKYQVQYEELLQCNEMFLIYTLFTFIFHKHYHKIIYNSLAKLYFIYIKIQLILEAAKNMLYVKSYEFPQNKIFCDASNDKHEEIYPSV